MHHFLLYSRKGLSWTIAPVSWLASKDCSCGAGALARVPQNHPVPASAFPENSSGPRRCPRLQLRGSAGFAPASLFFSTADFDFQPRREENARTHVKAKRM